MKGRHLIVLVIAAVLAVVAALWTSSIQETEAPEGGVGEYLLPGLADTVNEVSGVRLVGAGNEMIATLKRGEKTWQLEEKAGYRANIGDVRSLLLKLSEAKLLEEKTSNPAYYDRLGVQALDAADAAGVRVELEGVEAPAVIIGNQETTRDAVYVRRDGEETSWLASGGLFVSKDTLQWMDRELLDIDAARIAEVEIVHPDGETFLISKSAFGQANFDVAPVPDGRELQRDNVANPVGSVLQNLRIDDVQPEGEAGFSELEATRASFRAFDGLVIDVEVAARDDKYYARVSAATDAAVAARYQTRPGTDADDAAPETQPEADTAAEAQPGPVAAEAPEPDLTAVAAEADALNERLGGWIFQLPKFKYDYLTRRIDDVLKDEG